MEEVFGLNEKGVVCWWMGKRGEGEGERRREGRRTFCDELAVDFRRVVEFRQDDHSFPDVFSPHAFQGKGGGMAGGADGDGDPFAFDGADCCRGELAEGVGADEDGVAGVDEACGVGGSLLLRVAGRRE